MSLEIIVENSTLTFETVTPAELTITQTGTETLTISDTGPRGPVGYGVAAGGTAPQVLHKLSGSDYDTAERYPLPEGFSLEQNDTAQIEEEPVE